MLKNLRYSIRIKQLKAQHNKITAQLACVEWDSDQAFEALKEAFSSIISACQHDDIENIKGKASVAFIEQLTENQSQWKALCAQLKYVSTSIIGFYALDIALNAVTLDEGVCLCSDDLKGSIKAAMQLQRTSEGIKASNDPLFVCSFIWEAKKWRCSNITSL